MTTVFVYRDGVTRQMGAVDPEWLAPEAHEIFWVSIERPSEADRPLLQGVLRLHELAVEDALAERHHPKIESYDHFLYLILHAIDFPDHKKGFTTHDVDFFLGRNFLVTVQGVALAPLAAEQALCARHPHILAEGPVALLHRLADRIVDGYRPLADRLERQMEELEKAVFQRTGKNPLKAILHLKADVASTRRVVLPQRDAIARLARREFPQIPDAMAYRFRDVYDQLTRLNEEAAFLQDRITGLVDAYLSTQSNRMNEVMKVLTVIATIFMPLTVLTGIFGMNVALPTFAGGDGAQFWWIVTVMVVITAIMLWIFRRRDWL